MSRIPRRLSVATILSLCAISKATASCVPPAGFVDLPPPPPASIQQMVSRTERIVIDRPLAATVETANKPLRDAVRHTSALPGVAGEYPLTAGEFGAAGSRRLVCLTDDSTLEEQVLERTRSSDSYRFRYEVWNYTSTKARPIRYAAGDFEYTELPGGRTQIVWTYSFELKRDRFPGYLGWLGNFLFRVSFLDREWADLMRATLNGQKQDAESQRLAN